MLLMTACQQMEFIPNVKKDVVSVVQGDGFTLVGYTEPQTRTSFGSPVGNSIPFSWSAGDRIGINVQAELMDGDEVVGYAPEYILSNKLEVSSPSAEFTFSYGSVTCGDVVYYGAQVQNNYDQWADEGEEWTTTIYANVKTEQTGSPEDLGLSGDFGYAEINENNTFTLNHATSYLWLNSYSSNIETKVEGVRITATSKIAGQAEFVDGSLGEGTSFTMSIRFPQPKRLLKESSSTDIWAAAVILPINTTTLTVEYDFVGNTTATYTYNAKDIKAGNTYRISQNVTSTGEAYQLKVLTFEDGDAKFDGYTLAYANYGMGQEILKWSDLIDDPMYGGPLIYGDWQFTEYYWYDQYNTELYHYFPENGTYCYSGGGHAISNVWGEGYDDADRNDHIAKYYGEDYVDQWMQKDANGNYIIDPNTGKPKPKPGADGALGWFLVQLMAPIQPHSGENFAVHYGYKDFFSYIVNLPELSFYDEQQRIIDHMYVTNTNYTLNQLVNGVKSEEGNTFGGSWEGLNDDAWLKIVAYGYDSFDADPIYDEPTSTTEFYLVQGMKVVETWQKWDLSVLGPVAKVRFNFLYSESMGGSYGFTIPGYFAYDDVAVRFPAE